MPCVPDPSLPFPPIRVLLDGYKDGWWSQTALLGGDTSLRRMLYAGVPGGNARRLTTGGEIRRLAYRGPFADYVSHRVLPGRDPTYPGEGDNVLLMPCEWVSMMTLCDGLNIGYLGGNLDNFAFLTTIVGGFLKGAADTLRFAQDVLRVPHRAEVVILVEPDVLQMLESHLPPFGFRR